MTVSPLPAARAVVPGTGVAAVTAFLFLAGLTTAVDGAAQQWAANIGVLAFAAAAVVGCVRAARRSRGRSRRGWAALAVGAGAWGAGQVVWTALESLGITAPFPSVADIGYLTFPVAALVGLALLSPRSGWAGPRRLLDALTVGCALGLLAWFTVIDPLAAGHPLLEAAVSLTYPVLDVVLLTVTVLTLTQTGEKPLLWALLGLSMVAMTVSDVLFSYATTAGTYLSGSAVDWGWWAAFLFLGTAGSLVTGPRSGQPRPPAERTVAPASLLPYLPLSAVVLVAAVESATGTGLDPVAVAVIVVLVGLVLVRQYATVRDNVTLARTVQVREAELHELAFRDGLTGLANRALFLDRLGHALDLSARDRRPVSVVFLDLDGFKAVNDGLGHAMGDALLVRVAERLRATLRASDTLARLGGDEFAVLVEQGSRFEDDAATVAQHLLDSFSTPFQIRGRTVSVSASIGVASVEPGVDPPGADRAASLLHRADVAMYAVKEAGRGGGILQHSPSLDVGRGRDEPAVARAFAAALEQGLVRAVYQPVVDPVTGRIGAFEALARWTHDGVEIPPTTFVPISARAGLSEHLTGLMLDRSCAQLGAWNRALGHRRLRVAVNVNPSELMDATFPDRIVELFARHGLAAGQLALEITESGMTTRPETAVDVMNALRACGVRLALDDFGTGFSTLARLSSTPVDTVKIDRYFVADIDHDVQKKRFLVGLFELTRHLGLRTVAEGVERPGQLRELRRLGCDLVQGHLIGRPASAEDLTPIVLAEQPVIAPELLGRVG
ncbi:putative bifunctional diguanylate cyclase/phosphodiesterase [Pseudonocardia abyssalis]|uniref:EAL domain-containing protein n=2 Tax=Pseudonocardia abyssalis TaxID=2792008 RepID=A0ABS6UQP0_9PSEU|nr:EAL domain-containing protein [Pseudonocardia abyssalis]MBW0134571.1 EAL domain-containing protein [Pseudonocardia abyssalis]